MVQSLLNIPCPSQPDLVIIGKNAINELKVFIGLFEAEGESRGQIRFFDVREPPPKNTAPSVSASLDWDGLIQEVRREYEKRNGAPFRWADSD